MTANSPTITISGTAYRVVTQLVDTPTHRSFRVENEGRSSFLKVFRKESAAAFDKQMAALSSVKADAGLLLPIETGEYNDERFILREWVDGDSFDVYTRHFKFNPKHLDEALALGEQLARAVAPLHVQGIAHGRIKNENVFIDKDHDPIVTDPTGTGDPRDDVRQIGLLLCRLYTRKPTLAINSRTLMELSKAKVPMNLLKVLWQAIQEEPSQRFNDAGTLATALKEVPLKEHEKTVHVRAVPQAAGIKDHADARLKWGLAVVILIAAISGGAYIFWKPSTESDVANTQQVPIEMPQPWSQSSREPTSGEQPRITRLPSGVEYYDIQVGSGPVVTANQRVSIRSVPKQVEGFPPRANEVESMRNVLHTMRRIEGTPERFGEPKSREGMLGMRTGGLRLIGMENSKLPEENQNNYERNTGESLPIGGWGVILVEILDQGETTEAGLRITDLRMGSGEQLREGDTTNLRFRSQRVSLDSHLYKDWSGEADLSLQLSADGTQVEAFWRSLIGMREGGLRRIVIGPPASDGLKGIRNGQAYDFPSGTTWSYEVEAVSTLPEARSRIGVQIDIGSSLVGALISEVVGDPARQAGIAPGDLISSIDGVEIGSGQHGMRLFRRLEPQVPVRLMVSRGGAELELTIVPGEAPARETSDQTAESGALWIGGDAVLP